MLLPYGIFHHDATVIAFPVLLFQHRKDLFPGAESVRVIKPFLFVLVLVRLEEMLVPELLFPSTGRCQTPVAVRERAVVVCTTY